MVSIFTCDSQQENKKQIYCYFKVKREQWPPVALNVNKDVITFMGMMVAAGTAVSGTGASTDRIPSTESVDVIWVASISAGSLKKKPECCL